MTVILIELAIVLIGLGLSAVLFYHLPVLPAVNKEEKEFPTFSVIIPARNEEENLSLLLNDLSQQSLAADEIICADDASEDATAEIALSQGAKLVSLPDKPEGWTGKSWACKNGADAAKGELLLFLDADVRLGSEGLRRLLQAYAEYGCAISVQPYHKTEKIYEQFSMMFNLVQIAANGMALPKPLNLGMYGPVILISRSDYNRVGGHEIVRNSIVEDVTLGVEMKKAGLAYRLFLGDGEVAFRMYGKGMVSLIQGWTKNMASGAAKMPVHLFLMVFLWIASITSVPLHIIKFAFSDNIPWLVAYSGLHIVWMAVLVIILRRVGHFRPWAYLFYPIMILFLIIIFISSMFRKIFRLKVTWKGREIRTEEKL